MVELNAKGAEGFAKERKGFSQCTFAENSAYLWVKNSSDGYTQQVGIWLRVLHCADEFRERVLSVAVQHSSNRFKEERILKSGKTFTLAAF